MQIKIWSFNTLKIKTIESLTKKKENKEIYSSDEVVTQSLRL
jgi:hypothetical protein